MPAESRPNELKTSPENTPDTLLRIEDLSIRFPVSGRQGWATAVQKLNLSLYPGELLGLVGESGCGKSLSSLAILGLVPPPGVITEGKIWFEGQDLLTLGERDLQTVRGSQIAYIPQDPLTSLNPVYTVGEQIMEVLLQHQPISRQNAKAKAIALLDQVRIPNAKNRVNDYPHQFSGGMRQRVMIAMALSCKPSLLIADEPTTALDVTVQAQILSLIQDIRKEHGTTVLLITHDLGVVAETCDRVCVMYAGRLVEQGPVWSLFKNPKHPYTQGLLNSLPRRDSQRLQPIEGQPPALTEIPTGCAFVARCPQKIAVCQEPVFPKPSVFLPHPEVDEQEAHAVCCFLYPPTEEASTVREI
ncbi:MAG: ABC transporter ATP-binding protein [Candidatus Melainabacteria bacterium]|nr:ABC transporter ATP-binding protein [Candidatus Melainabacteria bacterium]